MKKIVFLVIIFTSILFVAPIRVDALSIDDYILVGKKTSAVTSTSEIKNIMGNGDGDAYQSLDVIDAYVKNNGGTCTRTEPKPVEDK